MPRALSPRIAILALAVLTFLIWQYHAQNKPLPEILWTKLDLTLQLLNENNAQSGRSILRNDIYKRALESLNSSEVLDMSQKDPSLLPRGATQRDYVSYGKYFWPSQHGSTTVWEWRDGQMNLEIMKRVPDYDLFRILVAHVTKLTLAYRLSGGTLPEMRQKALKLVSHWFLDPEVGMLPRLEHGAIKTGVKNKNLEKMGFISSGTCRGILDLYPISHIFKALDILDLEADSQGRLLKEGLRHWSKDYIEWHGKHPFSRQESRAQNNHGTAHDIQILSLLRFVHEEPYYPTRYSNHLHEVVVPRISKAITEEGIQPFEVSRKASWDYSLFHLRLLHFLAYELEQSLADLGKDAINLWTYTVESRDDDDDQFSVEYGESVVSNATSSKLPLLVAAHNFLIEHSADAGAHWPFKDIHRTFAVHDILVLLEDFDHKMGLTLNNRYNLGERWTKLLDATREVNKRQRAAEKARPAKSPFRFLRRRRTYMGLCFFVFILIIGKRLEKKSAGQVKNG